MMNTVFKIVRNIVTSLMILAVPAFCTVTFILDFNLLAKSITLMLSIIDIGLVAVVLALADAEVENANSD